MFVGGSKAQRSEPCSQRTCWLSAFLPRTPNGQFVDLQGWLTDADRDRLSFLATGTDTGIERKIIPDHPP
jgi:hypothetical protein